MRPPMQVKAWNCVSTLVTKVNDILNGIPR
jgi:hypothetical protein